MEGVQDFPDRRDLLKWVGGLGVGSAVFQRALALEIGKAGTITVPMIQQAEWISGIPLTEAEREKLVGNLQESLNDFKLLRAVELPNSVPPAITFNPAPWQTTESIARGTVEPTIKQAPQKPTSNEDLAFLPVTALSALVRSRQVSSTELTRLYLARLRQYDPALLCVVTYTEEIALQQAARADQEIASGRYRGPLHGIPWGAKDLIAYPGYRTTWGAPPYKNQSLDTKATVARKLEDAGAVLVAKLTLGALAMGDHWFGGVTRNPWNNKEGSSGSSAGSASAVAAGLVGFAIGSETLGSIVSPCRQCGATGLRPTFGRVSRHGCMTLSWSMDKLGPITRSVEDCALILGAIHGSDGLDGAAVDRPFSWPIRRDLRMLRVGYIENKTAIADREELKVLANLGVKLVPIQLPKKYPTNAMTLVLGTEAAAAFDDLTRKGITEGLNEWPGIFHQGQFVPAVEYLRAMRIRTLLMQEMDKVMEAVDLYVGGNDLLLTNLTGHPTAVMPGKFNRVNDRDKPGSITFTGRLYGEAELLAVASAYQQATGYHLRRPPLDKLTPTELK